MDILDRILDLLAYESKEQQQLSDYLGLKKSVVTDWKNEKSRSYMKYLESIASFFNVPLNVFYCDDDDYYKYKNSILTSSKIAVKDLSNYITTDSTAKELLDAYSALSLVNKAKALTYICKLNEEALQNNNVKEG